MFGSSDHSLCRHHHHHHHDRLSVQGAWEAREVFTSSLPDCPLRQHHPLLQSRLLAFPLYNTPTPSSSSDSRHHQGRRTTHPARSQSDGTPVQKVRVLPSQLSIKNLPTLTLPPSLPPSFPFLHPRCLDGPQVWCCSRCLTHLSTNDQIMSKQFTGRGGRAFLFDKV